MRDIVYDDDHIRVVWRPGSSDFLLITFGDLFSIAREDTFFADAPAEKLDLTCLGVMPKAANWFPAASLEAAAEAVRERIAPYADRVAYGGSMGGYAAIKFSRLFAATDVLAFCPQWSIDPAECAGNRNGYERFFKPEMAGMAIRADETAGRIHVFYDPAYAIDRFHYSRIALTGDVTPVPVFASDHAVTTILAGTSALKALIDASRSGDLAGLLRVVNRVRRKSPHRLMTLLRRSIDPHPRLTLDTLDHLAAHNRIEPPTADPLYADFAGRLIQRREAVLARRAIAGLSAGWSDRAVLLNEAAARGRSRLAPVFATAHKTVLGYNAITGKLAHVPASAMPPEFTAIGVAGGRLAVEIAGRWRAVSVGDKGVIRFVSPDTADERGIAPAAQTDGRFVLVHRGGYLSANPKGDIVYDRPAIQAWELFTPA